ncbi:MAG: hypothetical protein OI715_01380 (plasmid) [Candidatus Methanoperedens sp.]|nr:MAG: hypothetical protein OI715_01380 [Candidatus Methanoperedens sp.]
MLNLMYLSSFGTTINSNVIVNAITRHGIPVFHTFEMLSSLFFAGIVHTTSQPV